MTDGGASDGQRGLDPELQAVEDRLEPVLALDAVEWRALRALQQDKLAALLGFVSRHVPYYAELGLRDGATLADFPIVDKATLMGGLPQTCLPPGPTIAQLGAHLSQNERFGRAELYDDRFRVIRTSGTTGYIGYFLWDVAMARVADASATRFVPAPVALPKPFVAVAPIVEIHPLRGVLEEMHSVPFGVGVEATIERLHALRPKTIYGSTGLVAELADRQTAGDLDVQPEVVVVGSESCTASQRRRIMRAWGVKPSMQYGLSEAGLIASLCPEEHWHVHEDTVVLELLDEHGRPCRPGQRSAKALLTRLYGPVQPLIRYELGDVLVRGPDECPCGAPFATLAAIEGRRRAQLWLRGRDGGVIAVSASAVVGALEELIDVQRYQLRYETPELVEIEIVAGEAADAGELYLLIERATAEAITALGAVAPRIEVYEGKLPSVWSAPPGSKDHHVQVAVTRDQMAAAVGGSGG